MRTARILLTLLALLAAGLTVGGCQSLVRLFTSPSPFKMAATPPPDFQFVASMRDGREPEVDYVIRVSRAGRVEYDIQFRAPRRERRRGGLDLTEKQLFQFWDDIAATGYEELGDLYSEAEDGSDPAAGYREWFVRAGGREKRVVSSFTRPEPIASLIQVVEALLPADLLKLDAAGGTSPVDLGTPSIFVGDMDQRVFHIPSCPLVTDVPEQNRQPFPHHYDALNFGFAPCRECQPLRAGDPNK